MGVFGVWCGKCAKYLAFGTFTTPAMDALRALYFTIHVVSSTLLFYHLYYIYFFNFLFYC